MQKRYCLTLNLKNDPDLIRQYEDHHRKVWPEILKSIRDSGITGMEIYRYGNRLFMIMDVDETFDGDRKGKADKENPKVQEWEALMWKYQEAVEGAAPGEKWKEMKLIFDLMNQGYDDKGK